MSDKMKDMVDGMVEENNDEVVENVSKVGEMPSITSEKWTDYVIDQLLDSELSSGSPRVVGLRRLAQKLFGDIIKSDSEVITDTPDRATVKHTLVIERYEDGKTILASACVDALRSKTPYPFNQHLVSTACTSSESKALRRIMKLNIHTAEELISSEEEDTSLRDDTEATDQQISAIKTLCKRVDVNLAALCQNINRECKSIEDLKNSEARLVINRLSYFQRKEIPEEFKGYKENWEKDFK